MVVDAAGAAAVFAVGELAALATFALLPRLLSGAVFGRAGWAKGVLERAFLFLALTTGFPHALVLFGALKLGTRLAPPTNDHDEKRISNDFFLVGNLLSVGFALAYTAAWRALF